MSTFGEYIRGLTLVPGSGGVFDIAVNGETIFSRKAAGRFPDLHELKEAVSRKLE